jgi:hypothetical protein
MTSVKRLFLSKKAEGVDKLGYWVTKIIVVTMFEAGCHRQTCCLNDPLFDFRQGSSSLSSLIFTSIAGKPEHSYPYRTEVKNEWSYASIRLVYVQYRIFTSLLLPIGFLIVVRIAVLYGNKPDVFILSVRSYCNLKGRYDKKLKTAWFKKIDSIS